MIIIVICSYGLCDMVSVRLIDSMSDSVSYVYIVSWCVCIRYSVFVSVKVM